MSRILHLSDTHLTASGTDMDGVDASGSLARLLGDLRHLPPLDLVVVSGDVSDDGSAGGYADALRQVGGFARERGVPLVLTTGNHDDAASFAQVLGSAHLGADGGDVGRRGPGCAALSTHDGLRVVGLDSLVPGSGHGELGADQLTWLREELRTPAPRGTVLVLHHPPVTIAALAWQPGTVLRRPDELAAAIAGSDVLLVLCGHLHHQLSGRLAGVPVWVTPGVVTRIDLTSPAPVVRGVLGASASVHEVDDAGAVTSYVVHARDPRAGEQVYVYDPLTLADTTEA